MQNKQIDLIPVSKREKANIRIKAKINILEFVDKKMELGKQLKVAEAKNNVKWAEAIRKQQKSLKHRYEGKFEFSYKTDSKKSYFYNKLEDFIAFDGVAMQEGDEIECLLHISEYDFFPEDNNGKKVHRQGIKYKLYPLEGGK